MKIKFWIKNFRSITNCQEIEFDYKNTSYVFGLNNTGKSNIFSAIEWFFGKLENKENIYTFLTNNGMIMFKNWETYKKNNLPTVRAKLLMNVFKIGNVFNKINDIVEEFDLNISFENGFYFEATKQETKGYIDIFYNPFDNCETDMSKLFNKCYEKYQEFWPKNFFINEKNGEFNTFVPSLEITNWIETINNLKKEKLVKETKNGMINLFTFIFNIYNELTTKRKEFIDAEWSFDYISSLETENKVLSNFYLDEYFNNSTSAKSQTLNKILNALNDENSNISNNDIKKLLKDYYNTNIQTDKDLTLKNSYKNSFIKLFNKRISKIFEKIEIEKFPVCDINENKLSILINEDDNSEEILFGSPAPEEQSSGYKAIVWFIIIFISSIRGSYFSLILLDEPDKNLHYKIQQKLVYYLKEISQEKNLWKTFIGIISHSPFMLLDFNRELIYLTEINKEGSTILKKPTDNFRSILDDSLLPIVTGAIYRKWLEKYIAEYNDPNTFYLILEDNSYKEKTSDIENAIKNKNDINPPINIKVITKDYILSPIEIFTTKIDNVFDLFGIFKTEFSQKVSKKITITNELVKILLE